MPLTEYEIAEIKYSASILTEICHDCSQRSGWWNDSRTGEDLRYKKNVPTLLMLMVSELAEAMEGHRKALMDDHLPHRRMVEVELADTLIRIFDAAGGMGYDVAGAMVDKLQYNSVRSDHKPENRINKNGKQY